MNNIVSNPYVFMILFIRETICALRIGTAMMILLIGCGYSFAACSYNGPRFDGNTTSISSKLIITNNDVCGHIFRSWGKVKVDNLVISSRPRHGVAGIKNSISDPGFAYQPTQGFVGKDSFRLNLDDYNGNLDAKHTMTVDVEVDVAN